MSYIDQTRKSYSSPLEATVCLTKKECKALLPFLKKAHKDATSKYFKYEDIHEGGYATVREDNLYLKYQEQLEFLENLLQSVNDLIKSK